MKTKIVFPFIFGMALLAVWFWMQPGSLSPRAVGLLSIAHNTDQLILVGGIGGSDALLSFYEKQDGVWKEIFTTKAYVGKNGLGKTREGDLKTPVGVYYFTKAFGIAPDPGCMIPYTKVNESHYWVGDSRSPLYNTFVSAGDAVLFDRKESEHIIDYTKPYQYCLNINYNEEGKAKDGSAIFLHCFSNKKYTGGCIAISAAKMQELLCHIKEDCKIGIAPIRDLSSL
ncbi:MAG: L,D-transpeptidase family protein [Desulfovibrio sp.]|nr:L,D-transpeptidase family protein [Desulfovibrio sp.]